MRGDGGGEKMGFWKEDGEEFDQVEVALVPVVELHVDEFVVSGHVVVSDHAAVPLAVELHPDVSADEVVRGRGRGMRGRVWRGGGLPPSLPMGQRGWRWLERGEMRSLSPPVGDFVGGIHKRTSQRSPLVPPPTPTRVGTEVGEEGKCSAGSGGRWVEGGDGGGSSDDRVRPAMGIGPSCGMG